MDAQLEVKLIECLDALAGGESLDRILARYPQDAAQLRPLLETAAGLPVLRMEPSEAVKLQSRRKFMAQADVLRRSAPRKRLGVVPRFATGFLAAALVAVVLGTGAVAASGSALPGDPLYGLKRTVENVQLRFSRGAGQKALNDQFAQRRLDEINQLLSAGRPGEVEFTGTIEALQRAAWVVSGVVVQVDANTRIDGTPQIDRVAEVRGVTGPQGLRALTISIESSGEPVITPTPIMVATQVATEAPAPSPLNTPAPQVTPPPSPTAPPPPTATLRPTETPEPVEVEFSGTVLAIDPDNWNVDGTTVIVNANTEVHGAISLGQRVKVHALRLADGQLVARQIELLDGGGQDDGNSNQNPEENQNEGGGNGNNENSNSNEEDSNSNEDNGNSNEDNGNSNEGNGNSNENHNDDHGGNSNENEHNGNGN